MLKSFTVILISLSSFYVNSATYLANIEKSINSSIIVKKKEITNTKKDFKYISEFDLSNESGAGTYTNGNLVSLSTNQMSKPTLIVDSSEFNEARVKIQSFGANYANHLLIFDADITYAAGAAGISHSIFWWYNYDNSLNFYNNGTLIKKIILTSPSITDNPELRLNFETKKLSFYINNVEIYSEIRDYGVFPSRVYAKVFEGSGSTTPTKLLPE